jgi:hypothetical protein
MLGPESPMIVVFLLACSSVPPEYQHWFDQEPACDVEVYAWSDDVLAHVLTGDGDGSFDYDPEDRPRTQVDGTYNAGSGNIGWQASYHEDYWLERGTVEGHGTVFHNGDLDVEYTETTTDVLEVESAVAYRVERTGCSMTTWRWDPEGEAADALELSGDYDGDRFTFSGDDGDYEYRGSFDSDHRRTFGYESEDGTASSWAETGADGVTQSEWTLLDDACIDGEEDLRCTGTGTTAFDGSTEADWTLDQDGNEVARQHEEFAYDGDGTIVYEYEDGEEWVECVYTYEQGTCSGVECDDGKKHRC